MATRACQSGRAAWLLGWFGWLAELELDSTRREALPDFAPPSSSSSSTSLIHLTTFTALTTHHYHHRRFKAMDQETKRHSASAQEVQAHRLEAREQCARRTLVGSGSGVAVTWPACLRYHHTISQVAHHRHHLAHRSRCKQRLRSTPRLYKRQATIFSVHATQRPPSISPLPLEANQDTPLASSHTRCSPHRLLQAPNAIQVAWLSRHHQRRLLDERVS